MPKTKKSTKKSHFYSRWSKNTKMAAIFVLVFAALGGFLVFKSFAATGDELQAKDNAVWGANLAKKFQMSPGGGWGFTMDIYGGLHPFRTYGAQPAKPTGGPYWNNFAIARDFVVTKWDPANAQGYVLDGYGALQPFGGAPATKGGPYWNGNDIARKVVMRSDNTGGYVLDAWGALHPFAVGNNALPPAIQGPYFPGQDIARDVILTPDNTKGHILDCHGGISPFTVKGGAMPGYVNGYPYDAKRCDYVAFANVDWAKPSGYVISENGNFAGYGTNGWPGFVDPGIGKVIDAYSTVVAGTLRFWELGANGSIRAFASAGKPLYNDKEQAFFKQVTANQEKAAAEAAAKAAASAGSSGSSSSGGGSAPSSPGKLPGTINVCAPVGRIINNQVYQLHNYDSMLDKARRHVMGLANGIGNAVIARQDAWNKYSYFNAWVAGNCAVARQSDPTPWNLAKSSQAALETYYSQIRKIN